MAAAECVSCCRPEAPSSHVYLARGGPLWLGSPTHRATTASAPKPRRQRHKDALVTTFTIQAEGLVLQRSANKAGYKHVGEDSKKKRPFQVKMWHNGKQARFV